MTPRVRIVASAVFVAVVLACFKNPLRATETSFSGAEFQLGRRFQSETLRTISGGRWGDSRNRGKWIVVDLVASWCEACMRSLPQELVDIRMGRPRLTLLVVDERESPEIAQRLVTRFGLANEMWLDGADNSLSDHGSLSRRRLYVYYGAIGPFGRLAESSGVTMLPSQLLVDPRGIVRATWHGLSTQDDPLISAMGRFRLFTSRRR